MAGVERRSQSSRNAGLYRSTPCQNIAAIAADDSPWRSPTVDSGDPAHPKAKGDDDFKRTAPKNDVECIKYTTDVDGFRRLREANTHSPEKNSPNMKTCSSFDDNQTGGMETRINPRRGVVASKSAPSFGDNNQNHRSLSVWDRYNCDQLTIDEEENTGQDESRQESIEEYSPIVFSTPSTTGSFRRSSIPVRSHSRTSSASSDDNSSSLNFIPPTADNIGLNKHSVTPSSGQIAPRNLASQQRVDSSSAIGAKRCSSVTSQQLREAMDSGGGRPNVRKTLQRCKTTPSRLVNENYESFHRTSTAVPINTKQLRRQVSLDAPSSVRRPSKLPSRTASQPGSRSMSPSGKSTHLTPREHRVLFLRSMSARTGADSQSASASLLRASRIPLSQGHSRDGSPSRSSTPSEQFSLPLLSPRIFPAGSPWNLPLLSNRVLQTGTEMEQTLNDALAGTLSLQREEGASETSSVSSDISHLYSNSSLNPSEIIALISSASGSDRRQGLDSLQQLMKCNGYLNSSELKRVTEIFTRMFHDPNSKVFTAFLETLVDVIEVHGEEMNAWLYTCLSRLLAKLAGDVLGSVQTKIHKALQAICAGFSFESQLESIARFLAEHSLATNLRVKLAILDHLHEMTMMAEPYEFVASESCRQVALCVIQWTNEPKSLEIRKAAQNVTVALFNLNTPEFSAVLSKLPRSIQGCARRILHNHMHSVSEQMEPDIDVRMVPASEGGNHNDEVDDLSSEDYFSSLKKTAEDIQSLSIVT